MAIILTGTSCEDLERLFYRLKPSTDWRNAKRIEDSASVLALTQAPDMSLIRDELEGSWILRELPKPLELLVGDRDDRRVNRLAHARTIGNIPPGSLVRLGDGLYACSPEFRLLQSAKRKYLPAQAVYGLELCGIYLMYPGSENGFVECVPRTTPELVRDFITRCGGFDGAKQSRMVLRYLLANSRSPMESVLAVILVLSPRWGGYGLDNIELNLPTETNLNPGIKVPGSEKKCDIYFPDIKLDIEYQGSRHSGNDRARADSHRRLQLENAGVTVISLFYEDASNVSTMNKMVDRIRKLRGLDRVPPTREVLEARNSLFESLMPSGAVACHPTLEIAEYGRKFGRA